MLTFTHDIRRFFHKANAHLRTHLKRHTNARQQVLTSADGDGHSTLTSSDDRPPLDKATIVNSPAGPAIALTPDLLHVIQPAIDHLSLRFHRCSEKLQEEERLEELRERLLVPIKAIDKALSQTLQAEPESNTAVMLRARQYALLREVSRIDARCEDLEDQEKDLERPQLSKDKRALMPIGRALQQAGLFEKDLTVTFEPDGPLHIDTSLLERLEAEGALARLDKDVLNNPNKMWYDPAARSLEDSLEYIRDLIKHHQEKLDSITAIAEEGDDFPLPAADQLHSKEAMREAQWYHNRIVTALRQQTDHSEGPSTEENRKEVVSLQAEIDIAREARDRIYAYCVANGIEIFPNADKTFQETLESVAEATMAADRMLMRSIGGLFREASEADEETAHCISEERRQYLSLLHSGVTFCRGVLYESRMAFEESANGERAPWVCFGDKARRDQASSSSGYADGGSEAQLNHIEGPPGLAGQPPEPFCDRWRYSLGPFADPYSPPLAERFEAEPVDCDDSVCIRCPDPDEVIDPEVTNHLRTWQKMMGSVNRKLR